MSSETHEPRAQGSGLEQRYDPFSAEQVRDPHPIWKETRRSPVFFSQAVNAWVVTAYADVEWVLRDHGAFSSAGGTRALVDPPPEAAEILAQVPDPQGMDLLTSDPPRHGRLRRFMQSSFTPRRVADLEAPLRALAHSMIDRFEPLGEADFHVRFAHPFPLLAIGTLIGIGEGELEPVPNWVTSNLLLKWGSPAPDVHVAAARDRVAFYRFCQEVIEQRRASPGGDLLSQLILESDRSDDPLSEPELVGQIMTLLTAGHETTANWLTLAMWRLLEVPSRWDALRRDPASLPMAVEELLRFEGPALGLWRTAKADVEISGAQVRAGERLYAVVGAADRDDRVFPQPDDFVPDRENARAHLQFGRGIHTCLGAGLARLEGRVALEALVERLPSLRLHGDGDIVFLPNAIQRVTRRLMVEWDVTPA